MTTEPALLSPDARKAFAEYDLEMSDAVPEIVRSVQHRQALAAEARQRVMFPNETEKIVHYKNGREAVVGDKVVLINEYGTAVIGILYDAKAGNDYCNGKLAPISPGDPCPNLKECLHLDDVVAALKAAVPPAAK